jgi:beta-N-acetylhexosaminidase
MQHSYQEKREERRRRRQRNQLAAYLTLAVVIGLAAAGVVLGVRYLTRPGEDRSDEEGRNQVEEIFATEQTITMPEETAEPVPEMTEEEKLDEIVAAGIAVMPLEDKVAGLFLVEPEAITGVSAAIRAGESTQEALARYAVGGLVYFTKNMRSKEQLTEMISNTKRYSKYPLFFAVDEEGGKVNRVAASGLAQKAESAEAIGQTAEPQNAYQAGLTIGAYLSELGFNLDFAPVADLANVEGSVMDGRAYGSEAAAVAPFVAAMMNGLREQGVTACLKHFPGIGSTGADTHEGLSVTQRTAEEFRAEEFTVFRTGIDAGADMIMVGHLAAPALTGDNTPCSLSPAVVTDLLRKELGFEGVIITDAMNMGAVSAYYESGEAAILALKAGCDMILMPEDFERAYSAVLQAVADQTISEERINDSLQRIYRIKYADRLEPEEPEEPEETAGGAE